MTNRPSLRSREPHSGIGGSVAFLRLGDRSVPAESAIRVCASDNVAQERTNYVLWSGPQSECFSTALQLDEGDTLEEHRT